MKIEAIMEDLILILGTFCFIFGIYQVYPPASFITGGALSILAILVKRYKKRCKKGCE